MTASSRMFRAAFPADLIRPGGANLGPERAQHPRALDTHRVTAANQVRVKYITSW